MGSEEDLNTVLGRLRNSFRSETVIGKPTYVGDITLVPVMDVSLGLMEHRGNGGFGGLGVRVVPNSVVVVRGDEVSILSLKNNHFGDENDSINNKEEIK